MAHLMNVRPWEVDLMTVEQLDRACAAIDLYLETAQKATEGVR